MSRRSTALSPVRPRSQRFSWRHTKLSVKHTPDFFAAGQSLLELTLVAPKGCPLPITNTGYLSHFLSKGELDGAGGPVAFMTAWLDREATSKAYREAEYHWRQGDLFDGLETEDHA